MPPYSILFAVGIAAIGWLATVIAMQQAGVSQRARRLFMFPAWVVWITLALGAPALQGLLPLTTALSIAAAMTAGLLLPTMLSWRSPRR